MASLDNSLSVANNSTGFFFPPETPGVSLSGSGQLNSSSFTGGAQLGCNLQTQIFVWSVETDINSFRQSSSFGGQFAYVTNLAPYLSTVSADSHWLYTLRARVGWAIDRVLLYVTGGLAVTRVNFQQTFADPLAPAAEVASVSTTKAGWAIGGGLEYAFTNNWSVRGEYLFTQFASATVTGQLVANAASSAGPGPGCTGVGCGASFTNSLGHIDLQVLRVGVNYRF